VTHQAWQGALKRVPCGTVASGLVMEPPEASAYFRNSSLQTEHHPEAASAPPRLARGLLLLHSSSVSCRGSLVTQPEANAAEVG